jgi:hypothetical protein
MVSAGFVSQPDSGVFFPGGVFFPIHTEPLYNPFQPAQRRWNPGPAGIGMASATDWNGTCFAPGLAA